MAKIKLNPILEEVRGQIGDLVFREVNGETVLSRKPTASGNEPTQNQAEQRERFKQAVAYGRYVMSDDDVRELYEEASQRKGVPLFALTVADFLNPPVINQLDITTYNGQVGQVITINTIDDFGVVSVHVTITDNTGTVIESGNAEETSDGSGRWTYMTTEEAPVGTTALHVNAVATDRPGGLANLTNTKTL